MQFHPIIVNGMYLLIYFYTLPSKFCSQKTWLGCHCWPTSIVVKLVSFQIKQSKNKFKHLSCRNLKCPVDCSIWLSDLSNSLKTACQTLPCPISMAVKLPQKFRYRKIIASFKITWCTQIARFMGPTWEPSGADICKAHGAYMGPTWGLLAPDGPHVGPMNLAIRVITYPCLLCWSVLV